MYCAICTFHNFLSILQCDLNTFTYRKQSIYVILLLLNTSTFTSESTCQSLFFVPSWPFKPKQGYTYTKHFKESHIGSIKAVKGIELLNLKQSSLCTLIYAVQIKITSVTDGQRELTWYGNMCQHAVYTYKHTETLSADLEILNQGEKKRMWTGILVVRLCIYSMSIL